MELTLPENARRALDTLEAAGFESWAVGGCVRDSLLSRAPKDWDLCTAAKPEETLAVFAGERTIPTGLKHGTVTLLTEDGPLEITTFRRDGDYSDGRRPDSVDFVSAVTEDLRRRDFTVNAMAYSPLRGLRDEFGGQEDLRAGLIRCVGDADERFHEDALRILRALRFASRYGFAIEEKTADALRRGAGLLERVSRERIFSELRGILIGPGAGDMLRRFPEVFFAAVPELAPMAGFPQRTPRHDGDVWEHTVRAVDAAPPDETLRLTMLFHDSGKPAVATNDADTGRSRFYGHQYAGAALADRALRSLRCDNATRERVVRLVEHHELRTGHRPADLRRLLARLGEEDFRRLLVVRRADAEAHAPAAREELLRLADADEATLALLLAEDGPLTIGELAVRGKQLRSLGYAGPAIGRVLSILLDEALDGRLKNEKTALLSRAEELKNDILYTGGDTMQTPVTVTWLGHSCFRLQWGDFTLITDPYSDGAVPGYGPLRAEADAVFCSHAHRDHGATDCVTLTGKAAPEGFSVEEATCPHDHHNGEHRGMNTIRVFRFGSLRVAHMGDVGCALPEETLRLLRGVDALLLPVGGHYTVNAAEAYGLWKDIAPRVVVPMHYCSKAPAFGYEVLGGVEDFLGYFAPERITEASSESFTLSSDAPSGVVLLKYVP